MYAGSAVLAAEAYVGTKVYQSEKAHEREKEEQEQQLEVLAGRRKPTEEKPQARTGSSASTYPPWSSA